MRFSETIMANKLRRSKTLTFLFVAFVTLSTMSLTACSDNDNNTGSQRVVHSMVYFDDEGPVATAWVQDGDQNFITDAILSINDRPFEVTYYGEEASDEDNVPIYYLELYDLKGGDSLTFVAKRSDGSLIYAPPSAQIPMPLELVEPVPDQPVIPGEEVVVRWAGGEGSTHIAAFYADDLGEEQYLNVQKYGDVESITVPTGIIREGGGIVGSATLSGDHSSLEANTSEAANESSFIVYRSAAIHTIAEITLEGLGADCPSGQIKGSAGVCCPNQGMHSYAAAKAVCLAEHVVLVGMFIWDYRLKLDKKAYPPCDGPQRHRIGSLRYCAYYSRDYSHFKWKRGCVCPHS